MCKISLVHAPAAPLEGIPFGLDVSVKVEKEEPPSVVENTTPCINNVKLEESDFDRTGKWTREEEMYAYALVDHFQNGTLSDCDNGDTLRAYVSRKIQCLPMRVSKKFAGLCIGKNIFVRSEQPIDMSDLAILREAFLISMNKKAERDIIRKNKAIAQVIGHTHKKMRFEREFKLKNVDVKGPTSTDLIRQDGLNTDYTSTESNKSGSDDDLSFLDSFIQCDGLLEDIPLAEWGSFYTVDDEFFC